MSTVRTGVGIGILLGIVLSALLWVAAQPAHAQTVDECQAGIAELRAQTLSTTFAGQNAAKDQAGLLGKLDSATTKLGEGKTADALKNLNSFSLKVSDLADQGKLDPADANILLAKAGAVIDCIDPPEEPSQTTA